LLSCQRRNKSNASDCDTTVILLHLLHLLQLSPFELNPSGFRIGSDLS
jgi:hypothetical protein